MSPATSRRTLIGSSAAMLLPGVYEAGPTKANEADQDLIEASREFLALEAEADRLCAAEADMVETKFDAQSRIISDRQKALRVVMATTPARTVEGLRAKAAALRAWLPSSDGGPDNTLAASLYDDMLGLPAEITVRSAP